MLQRVDEQVVGHDWRAATSSPSTKAAVARTIPSATSANMRKTSASISLEVRVVDTARNVRPRSCGSLEDNVVDNGYDGNVR